MRNVSESEPINEGLEEARAAKERLERLNTEVEDQWPDVIEVSSTLYDLRQRNHFADMIMAAIKG